MRSCQSCSIHHLKDSIPAGRLILRVSYGWHGNTHSYPVVITYQLQLRKVHFFNQFFALNRGFILRQLLTQRLQCILRVWTRMRGAHFKKIRFRDWEHGTPTLPRPPICYIWTIHIQGLEHSSSSIYGHIGISGQLQLRQFHRDTAICIFFRRCGSHGSRGPEQHPRPTILWYRRLR